MKSLKLFIGTFALLLGFNSIAAWAADETVEKQKGEKVEVPDSKNSENKRGEPICGDTE